MARELKVFSMMLNCTRADNIPDRADGQHVRQINAIVAVHTKKESVEKFGVTAGEMYNFGGETGNEQAIEVAMSKPGQVFARSIDDHGDKPYIEISRQPRVPIKRSKRIRYDYSIVPKVPVKFTLEELEAIVGRFQMANDPVGQSILDKVSQMMSN